MEAKAKLKHLRVSPQKVRLVLDAIRGLKVTTAQAQLSLMNKSASEPILKLLDSAVANAENNFDLKKDNLIVKEVFAGDGPTLKRWMPRAFGRATPIRKRTTHIDITLSEIIESKEKKDSKKKDKIEDARKVSSLDEVKGKEEMKSDTGGPEEGGKASKSGKGFAQKVFRRKSA